MADLLVKNIDPVLHDRLLRVAAARGWDLRETAVRMLEHGLFAAEQEISRGFDSKEADALSAAIAALRQVAADELP